VTKLVRAGCLSLGYVVMTVRSIISTSYSSGFSPSAITRSLLAKVVYEE